MHRIHLGLLVPLVACAQTRPAWDGLFTAAQAQRGQTVYRESCARCHGQDLSGGENSPALTGGAFLAPWAGKSALALLDRTRRTMPTDNPGGLSARQYADTLAYVLSVNRFSSGAAELGPAATIPSSKTVQWKYYGGDAGSKKYSPLDQIDPCNVAPLKIAWSWKP